VKADYDGERQTIRDIMVSKGEEGYDDSYEVDEADLQGWEYAKAAKKEFRIRKADAERWPELWKTYRMCIESQDQSVWDEHRQQFIDTMGDDGSYKYEEGQIAYPDSIDKPSRTVVTAEIGRSASRMRHLIKDDDGTHRTLFAIETERLNQFPDNWTKIEVDGKEIVASRQGFLMGNALVVGVIERLREPLLRRLKIGDPS
jgi:DNA (cytosine-5)-methyltransferase 1